MPEMQNFPFSGEMTRRFIEFVMIQSQQAALFLGSIPNPQTGKTEVHLDAAKLFIDQLEMIGEKTRGNLTGDESKLLAGVLADLRLAFVQASSGKSVADSDAAAPIDPNPEPTPDESENKKKFSKSYGA